MRFLSSEVNLVCQLTQTESRFDSKVAELDGNAGAGLAED